MDRSQNRLMYDKCAYNEDLTQSVSPLAYMLDKSRFENVNKCRIPLGGRRRHSRVPRGRQSRGPREQLVRPRSPRDTVLGVQVYSDQGRPATPRQGVHKTSLPPKYQYTDETPTHVPNAIIPRHQHARANKAIPMQSSNAEADAIRLSVIDTTSIVLRTRPVVAFYTTVLLVMGPRIHVLVIALYLRVMHRHVPIGCIFKAALDDEPIR